MDITKKDLPALKKAYNRAVKGDQTIFIFKGYELYTDYAKYLIESLEL